MMESVNIRFLRHGETEWNISRRIQGSLPFVDLSKAGLESSLRLADEYATWGEHFDRLYTSPLLRAVRTADVFGKTLGLKPIIDSRLGEMSFGRYEGSHYGHNVAGETLYADDNIRRCFEDPCAYAPLPDGESFEDVLCRTDSFLRDMAALYSERPCSVLVVTHGGIACAIQSLLKGIPISNFWEGTIGNLQTIDVWVEESGIRI